MTRHGEFRDILLLLLLGTVWGGSFLLIKISVDTVPPLTIAAVRLAIAAVCLAALARALGQRLPDSLRGWSIYLAIGFFGNTLPFALIGYGEIHIDSGVAAILMAGVPLFTLVMAHYFVPGERTTVAKLAGISIGLSGIVVLVGVDALGGLGAQFIGQLTVLGAAFSYALVNIFASRIRHLPPAANGAAAMIGASLWAVPASLIVDQPWTLTPDTRSLAALLALGLISTAAGNVLFFRIMSLAGPSFLSLVNFIVPVMGVFWGWLILSERLGWKTLAALVLILTGIAVVRWGTGIGRRGVSTARKDGTKGL